MATFINRIENRATLAGIERNTKESLEWFKKEIQNIKTFPSRKKLLADENFDYTNKPLIGRMFMYIYDPKHKKTLPYYDRFPLVYVIKAASKTEFWGANLHYLSPKKRIVATRKLMQGRIDIPKRCFHKYLQPHVDGLMLDLASSEWDTAILLPTEDFVKDINGRAFPISKEDVWEDTNEQFYDKIRGQRVVKGYGTPQSREMSK